MNPCIGKTRRVQLRGDRLNVPRLDICGVLRKMLSAAARCNKHSYILVIRYLKIDKTRNCILTQLARISVFRLFLLWKGMFCVFILCYPRNIILSDRRWRNTWSGTAHSPQLHSARLRKVNYREKRTRPAAVYLRFKSRRDAPFVSQIRLIRIQCIWIRQAFN